MADHLPDDLRQWPDDPFQLLGVNLPATEIEVKRAYSRLIRQFKPEHNPDQFRRVREAYELALQRLQWIRYYPVEKEADSVPFPNSETHVVEGQPGTPSQDVVADIEHAPNASTRSKVIDPAEEAWSLAVGGQWKDAYTQLVELAQCQPESADAPLRLYWLLAMDPGLDTSRSRHDWLAQALTQSHLGGPARELYRRELAANAQEALFGPYARLLESIDIAPEMLISLALERLAPASDGQWWERLDVDLCALANRSKEYSDTAWLSYLVEVMGRIAFERPQHLFVRCQDLLGELRHLELSHTWAFDRIEELHHLSRQCRLGARVPSLVREVVRHAWFGSYASLGKSLARASIWAAEDPLIAIGVLDRAAGDHDAQPFFETLRRLLEDRAPPSEPAYPDGVIRGLVAAFLTKGIRKDYPSMRPALLRFLLDERIDPDELVRACCIDSQFVSRSLVEHIRNDGNLWLCYRLTALGANGHSPS